MKLEKKKLLILCMGDSPHAARWINNISKDKYDVHVFPCTIYGVVTGINDVTIHSTFASVAGNKILSRSKSLELLLLGLYKTAWLNSETHCGFQP